MDSRICLNITIAHERFLNLYGEPGARLRRLQSVHGHPKQPRHLLFRLVDPLLFYVPRAHLRELEKTSVDRLVKKPALRHLKEVMCEEWKEFTLYVGFYRSNVVKVFDITFRPRFYSMRISHFWPYNPLMPLGSQAHDRIRKKPATFRPFVALRPSSSVYGFYVATRED